MNKSKNIINYNLLFPLLCRVVMSLGLTFEMAGTFVNNLAFLVTLSILYFWIEERYGTRASRWSIAVYC